MAWTSDDLVLIEKAIRDAIGGKIVSFGGKTWTSQTITELMQLRQAIAAEIALADGDTGPGITMTPTMRGW